MIQPIKLYNDQIELLFNDDKHQYYVESTKIPSVTKILGVINKPALVNWAANQAVESMASQLRPGVIYDEIQIKQILETAKKAHYTKKTDAGTIGTFVHDWIERYITGQNPEMPINEDINKSVQKFLKWQEQYQVKFLMSEVVVYSQKFAFSGTLDFVARIDGKLVLGDIKTSSGIWDEYWLQTAAYQLARTEEFTEEVYDYRGIIRVGKDGSFEWKTSSDYDLHLKAFLAAKVLFDTLESMKTDS